MDYLYNLQPVLQTNDDIMYTVGPGIYKTSISSQMLKYYLWALHDMPAIALPLLFKL